jgi:hypothetical protein
MFVVAVALILFGCFYATNAQLRNFATLAEVTAAAMFFATAFWLLWHRVRIATCLLLLIPCLYSYGLVNPISRGLPGMTQSGIFRWLSKVHENDRGALWIVTGNLTTRNCYLAQLLKATGATALGGTRCMPDHEMLRVLDPEDRHATVHNRYARICFQASTDTNPGFELLNADYYLVRLPLQGPLLERLGIKYVLIVDQTEMATPAGFERVGEKEGCVLLRCVAGR